MLTGFNTDIDFNGRVYHVQTEDRGLKNPIVESLVYSGGEIITSRKSPYEDLIAAEGCREDHLLERMESQHRELIREVQAGLFETELLPFGHSIVTNRSLDQVVRQFLAENVCLERIKLAMKGPKVLREKTRPKLRLSVMERSTERPVCGATVEVRLIAAGTEPRELFSAFTDDQGRVEAAFEIPALQSPEAAIVCKADAAGLTAKLKRLVRKSPTAQ